ncbi:efflux RND transporter permease subunit [Tautonia plasticadhaerens]|uniref:Cobalt-zinc-cadmium resistance protein CzcA n=1 Tax=Tautonia plasticadhaerens TaxID=2527974 RepID=A0A518GZF1_9BACT|nr:CusA/CzcA family heavy metal efflux RND transporter [Tautonia plasticadhaerens]QDV33971.1 Cobalt-zinc-cadmium resistance protein CzcA [Tautonia plasticadhaerens]
MLNALINFSLQNRVVVLLLAGLLVFVGVNSALRLPLDAFPDTTPNQVQINTVAPSMTPEQIELLVTYPVELALGGLKGLEEVRSISKFGLSQVVAIFDEATDIYFARQQITERLSNLRLSPGIDPPQMGPVATGLGEIYHYYLTSDAYDLTELRTLHDWVVRPRLIRVPGVAEINTLGGFAKQYEVKVDPDKLAKYHLTFDDLTLALRENNTNVGGGPVDQAGQVHLVQGVGLLHTTEDISDVVITSVGGVPIRVRDVAEVDIGHAIRRGGTTAHGKGEVVLGLAFMRMGENSREVTNALEAAMADVRQLLPPDVDVKVVYRRTDLIARVLHTVEKNLFEGAILVIAVLFAFLGNLRAGLIVAAAIPLSMLFAVSMMQRVGIAGSLMSLGAIDFGLVVDSSVVMIENCVRRLSHDRTDRPKLEVVRDAAVEVRKPTMFGELIIMVVYLPILTLEGVEGKMFRPMALTVIFALLGSMVLSLTLMPVLASFGLSKGMSEKETIIDRVAHALYRPLLDLALRNPMPTLGALVLLTLVAARIGLGLGSEFIPRLAEGSLVFNTVRLASVNLEESQRYGTRLEQILLEEFPDEIDDVWTRTGTAEVATDPMGLELSDVFVTLKPRGGWTRAVDQEDLVNQMAEVVDELPGMEAVFSQPIEQRINEMIAGIRADLGIKLFGDDLETLQSKASEIARVVEQIPGAADVSVEQVTGLPVMRIAVDRQAVSRHGVPARVVLDAIEAVGGSTVGEIFEEEGGRRFPLVVRLPEAYRDNPDALKDILIPTADGARLPLTRLVRFEDEVGPAAIPREWGKRRIIVQANVRGRDVGTFVEEARGRIASEVALPSGYAIEWGGQFENLIRARDRLNLVVPLSLILTMSLLYLTFNSLRDALLIFTGLFFATNGGVFGLWLRGMPFTISAGVGFIALNGASMLMGLVLINAVHGRMRLGMPRAEAIREAALERLRPVLMTGTVAALGFLPMALSTGFGAEVQRPLATVVVFGMASATILTMISLPVLYLLFGRGPDPDPGAIAEARGEEGGPAPAR